jgi:YegS/Rv2252/BmrU family lipid kinase
MNVTLIVNPIAGKRAYRSIKKIEDLLKRKVSLNTFITQKKGDAESFAKQISSELNSELRTQNPELLIVAGGDGTFNEVINGILSAGSPEIDRLPLAFLPLGTTNVLAKELGVPENIEKAINLALTGSPKRISLGRINGRYFASMAGIGFDGEVVFRLNENIKKISGKGSHILSGINCLMKYKPPLIEIKTSGGILTGYTAVVGNASCYAGYFKITPEALLTEPLLDLCLFKGKTRKDLVRFVSGVIRKKHLTFDDVFYGKFSELEITSKGNVRIQIDGDYFGTLPVRIDVVKDAVSVIW